MRNVYRIKLVFDNDEDLELIWNKAKEYKEKFFPQISLAKGLSYVSIFMRDDYRCEESVETAWNDLLDFVAFVFKDMEVWHLGILC